MQITTIFNEGNTTQAVNQLPVTLMQPMDHILNLLCIHYIDHIRNFGNKDIIHIYFDADLEPDFTQIIATFNQFGFDIIAKQYWEKSKCLVLVVSQSKAILN